MISSRNFDKKIIEVSENEKFEKIIQIINKLLKIVLLTSSLLVFLTILFIVFCIYSDLNKMFQIIVFSAFYSIIFGVLPIIGFLILTKLINRKLKTEILKLQNFSKLLLMNLILIVTCILTIIFFKSHNYNWKWNRKAELKMKQKMRKFKLNKKPNG